MKPLLKLIITIIEIYAVIWIIDEIFFILFGTPKYEGLELKIQINFLLLGILLYQNYRQEVE